MSANQSESNQGFGGVAQSAGARLSTQEAWQRIGDMAGQVRALATLHTSLHNALFATLASPKEDFSSTMRFYYFKLKNKKVFRFGIWFEPVSYPVKAHAVDPTIARESPLTPYSRSLGEVL